MIEYHRLGKNGDSTMLVHSIKNNQLNFGALYVQKHQYSDSQKNTIKQIKEAMSQPSEKFSNQSAEDFYKSKGIDFFIESGKKGEDSISLSGYDEIKHSDTGIDEAITCKESFSIGTYNEEHPFKTDDIAKGLKEFKMFSAGNIIYSDCTTQAFAGQFFSRLFDKVLPQKSVNTTNPLNENLDSIARRASIVVQDTVKTLKSAIK